MRVGVATDHGLSDINECPPIAGLRFLPLAFLVSLAVQCHFLGGIQSFGMD